MEHPGSAPGEDLRRPVVQLSVVGVAVSLGLLPVAGLPVALVALAALGVWATITWFARFDLLLHLLVLSVFIESVGVGPLRVGRLLAATAVAALVARAVFTDWRPRLARSPGAVLPIAVFVVWAWASGLWAANTGAWAYAMGQLGLALAYFVTFALVVERRRQLHQLLRTMVLGAVFASFVAFAQVAAGAPRAEGLQGDPNIYALYQVASLPAAAFLATSGPAGRRWTGWVALPIILLSVVATSSRGGLATAVAVLVVMFARGDFGARLRRHRTAAVSTAVLAAVGTLTAVMALNKRFAPERVLSDRASGRFDIWYVAFREWQEHPLLGIGGGGFKPRSVELLVTEPGVQLVKSHLLLSSGIEVHNIYLETLVEYGAVGFLLFVGVLVCSGWHLRQAARLGTDPAVRALPMVLLAFLAASFFLSVVNNKLLWMLIGLAVVVSGRTQLPDSGRPPSRPGLAARPLSEVPRPLLGLAALCALVPLAVGVGATAFVPATWTSSVQFVVNTSAGPGERESTVRTLESLATSRVVAVDLLQHTGVGLTPEQLVQRVRVERPGGALTFSVHVDDRDRAQAAALARGVAAVFPVRVSAISRAGDESSPARYSLRPWGGGAETTAEVPRPLARNGALALGLGSALAALVLTRARRPLLTSARQSGMPLLEPVGAR